MKPKVKYLLQTCYSNPTQFEGNLEDGRQIYIRFRWGTLRYGMAATQEETRQSPEYQEVAYYSGDEYAGFISYKKVVEKLSEVLDFSECKPNLVQKKTPTPRQVRDALTSINRILFKCPIKNKKRSPFKK